jgi:hypothetical protein
MEYIPGSHKLDQIPHRDTFAKHNLLTRGQEVMVEVDHSQRRIISLRPGEMSLHHVRLVHGSPPNPSNDRRIGFAIRYIPTTWRSSLARTVPSSCAARTALTISCRSRSRAATSTPNSWHSPHHHRAQHKDPLSRHRHRQLQRAEGAGATQLNRDQGRVRPSARTHSQDSLPTRANAGIKNPVTPAKAGAHAEMDPGLRREGEEGDAAVNHLYAPEH